MDERRLIDRVLAGDGEAERALYDAHVVRVYRLAFRLAGEEEFAREITQEAFIRAFDRLDRFRGDSAFGTWIHAITVSVALNGIRRRKRREAREVGLDAVEAVAASRPTIEPDLKARVHAAIDALPEIYRVVFVMHDVEGYTHEEIGRTLDIAAGTSKARLHRARARLREELAGFAEEYAR